LRFTVGDIITLEFQRGHEAIPAAMEGLDNPVPPPSISQRLPHLHDAGGERSLSDELLW
jgi:hypothetical protein